MLPQRYYFAFSSSVDCWQAAATVQRSLYPIISPADRNRVWQEYNLSHYKMNNYIIMLDSTVNEYELQI
jgi:hypothetical protein